jgi:hypothetical protein
MSIKQLDDFRIGERTRPQRECAASTAPFGHAAIVREQEQRSGMLFGQCRGRFDCRAPADFVEAFFTGLWREGVDAGVYPGCWIAGGRRLGRFFRIGGDIETAYEENSKENSKRSFARSHGVRSRSTNELHCTVKGRRNGLKFVGRTSIC